MLLCKCHFKCQTVSKRAKRRVKVTSVGTKTESKLKVKAYVVFLPICLSFYMIQMWKIRIFFYVQTLACKNLEANVSWKRRNKTWRCGMEWYHLIFLNSQDLASALNDPCPPIYPQNPGSLCFHSGSWLSEPHIYGPCLIIVSTCCFTSLCSKVSILLIIHGIQGCFPLCECNKHPKNVSRHNTYCMKI